MSTHMNPEARALWLEALRSGRYLQERGQLTTLRTTNDGKVEAAYCCLGVLCEVARLAGVELTVTEPSHAERVYDGEENYPPPRVLEWAGLATNNPTVRLASGSNITLSMANDEVGLSFVEIADLVEGQL